MTSSSPPRSPAAAGAALRVFIVDDHPLFRAGVRHELTAHADRVEVKGRRRRPSTERVEDEPGQSRREHGVPRSHGGQCVYELGGRDRFGDITTGTGTDGLDDVVRRVRDGQGEETDSRSWARDLPDDLRPSPSRHMHVHQHHVG